MSIRREITEYGFRFGAAEVERQCWDNKKGVVYIGVKTARADLQIYVTKTGKVRVFTKGGELVLPPENAEAK